MEYLFYYMPQTSNKMWQDKAKKKANFGKFFRQN